MERGHDRHPVHVEERTQLPDGVGHVEVDDVGLDPAGSGDQPRRHRHRQHPAQLPVPVDGHPVREHLPHRRAHARHVDLDLVAPADGLPRHVVHVAGDAGGERREEVLEHVDDLHRADPSRRRRTRPQHGDRVEDGSLEGGGEQPPPGGRADRHRPGSSFRSSA